MGTSGPLVVVSSKNDETLFSHKVSATFERALQQVSQGAMNKVLLDKPNLAITIWPIGVMIDHHIL